MKNKQRNLVVNLPISVEMIDRRIYLIRGQKVMLDADLAELYQVETFNLNKAVKRNIERFPQDFMFRLTAAEFAKVGYGGRRYLPYVFTEQGVAILSSVLNSKRAIAVNIAIMRAFVKLREIMATHKDLARKIEKLEDKQKKQHLDIAIIFNVIKKLLNKSQKPQKQIGFRT